MGKTRRLSVDLGPVMFAALERRARNDGTPMTSVIRTALRRELGEEIKEETDQMKTPSKVLHPKFSQTR